MNKLVIIGLTVTALAFAGCTTKHDAPAAGAAADKAEARQIQPSPAHGGPAQGGAAANPHANMSPHDMAAAPDHKGKVLSSMDSAGYTYIEVQEKNKKLWVAVMQVEVKAGDEVVFPDSPPVVNFHSKTLNRTFDTIILTPAIQVNGKPGQMGAHPKTN